MFQCDWPHPPVEWSDHDLVSQYQLVRSVRTLVNKTLDMARSDKLIRGSLEATLLLTTDSNTLHSLLTKHEELSDKQFSLSDIFIVSGVNVSTNQIADVTQGHLCVDTVSVNGTECKVQVTAVPSGSAGVFKCPRCWKVVSNSDNTLCTRCASVQGSMN